jgi:hypothetical protein
LPNTARLDFVGGAIAQLEERRVCNAKVAGSIPAGSISSGRPICAKAAHEQFEQDVRAAVNAFKSALRPIKESLEGGGHGPGKHGPPVGAN